MQPFSYGESTALVTGASRGIGAALAKALAARDIHALALVARSKDDLEKLASDIFEAHGIRVETIPVDLAESDAAAKIEAEMAHRGMTIDLLVNNAGFGTHDAFDKLKAKTGKGMIAVNIQALVDLTQRFLPGMIARNRGGIVNIASTAAFQPVPYMAVYGATKAFVLSFTEAISQEVRDKGADEVRIVALCPGATATAFGDNMLRSHFAATRQHTPEQVADETLRALDRNTTVAVVGAANYAMVLSERLAPRSTVARVCANLFRPDGEPGAPSGGVNKRRLPIFAATLGVAAAVVTAAYIARRRA